MYYLNQDLDIQKSDNNSYIINVPYKNGFKTFEANYHLIEFIKTIKSPLSREQLIYNISIFFDVTTQKSEEVFLVSLLKSHLFLPIGQTTESLKKDNGVLLFRKKILSATKVNTLSRHLSKLCDKQVVIALTTIGLMTQLGLLYDSINQFVNFSVTSSNPWVVLLLVIFGLIFHELGHAAAAYKFGCRKVTIGFGWYTVFFVMLADLSESWSLKRRQRIFISLAGSYFQTIYVVMLCIIGATSTEQSLITAAKILAVYNILNLNPFFRLDGYWLASDLMNITNLRAKSIEYAKCLLSSLFRKHNNLQKHSIWFNIYTVSLILFLPFFYGTLLLYLLPKSFQSIWTFLESLFDDTNRFDYITNSIPLFFSTMIALYGLQLLRKIIYLCSRSLLNIFNINKKT